MNRREDLIDLLQTEVNRLKGIADARLEIINKLQQERCALKQRVQELECAADHQMRNWWKQ